MSWGPLKCIPIIGGPFYEQGSDKKPAYLPYQHEYDGIHIQLLGTSTKHILLYQKGKHAPNPLRMAVYLNGKERHFLPDYQDSNANDKIHVS